MKTLRIIRLIAWRDFWERFATRGFQISSAVIMIIVAALIVVPWYVEGAAPSWTVGVTGEVNPDLQAAIEAAAPEEDTSVEVVTVTDGEVEQAVRDGEVDLVVDDGELITSPGADPTMLATVAAVVGGFRFAEAAEGAGLDAAATAELLAATAIEVTELEPEEGDDGNVGAAFIASILLFMAIVFYGQWILTGVVEEKASRVVEVVLGTVRSHHLLAGKIAGIGALGALQLVVIGITAAVAGTIAGTLDVPSGLGSVAWIVMLWFVLGFAFYATAFAAAGSLVSRIEDAQNAALPLTLLLMIGYFGAAFSIEGDNPVLQVMSLLPPFAPVTMPVRMAAGTATAWEIVLSIALMVVATWLLVRVAGRVYAGGLLQGGRKTKVREAWTSARG
ncbi:MAG: ABC transporter permease [Actinobacteria bacterium]|nr:MAG: ABC transporter permease [Actinomycetota bacterium]